MSFKLTIGRLAFTAMTVYPNEAIVWISPRDLERVSRGFLAHYLASRDLTGGSVRAVKGETLNSTSLAAIEVRVPPNDVQESVVTTLESARMAAHYAEAELAALGAFRTAILPLMLSGGIEIPESYDELVGAL